MSVIMPVATPAVVVAIAVVMSGVTCAIVGAVATMRPGSVAMVPVVSQPVAIATVVVSIVEIALLLAMSLR